MYSSSSSSIPVRIVSPTVRLLISCPVSMKSQLDAQYPKRCSLSQFTFGFFQVSFLNLPFNRGLSNLKIWPDLVICLLFFHCAKFKIEFQFSSSRFRLICWLIISIWYMFELGLNINWIFELHRQNKSECGTHTVDRIKRVSSWWHSAVPKHTKLIEPSERF